MSALLSHDEKDQLVKRLRLRIAELERPVEDKEVMAVFEEYYWFCARKAKSLCSEEAENCIEEHNREVRKCRNKILPLLHRERSRADKAEQRISELEAQVPKVPKVVRPRFTGTLGKKSCNCGVGHLTNRKPRFCENCGAKLDWSES